VKVPRSVLTAALAGTVLIACSDIVDLMPALMPPASVQVAPGDGSVAVTWTASPSEAERSDIGADGPVGEQGGYTLLRTPSVDLDSLELEALLGSREVEGFLRQDSLSFQTFEDTLLFARRLSIETRTHTDAPVTNDRIYRYAMITRSDDGAHSVATPLVTVVPHRSYDTQFQVGWEVGANVQIKPSWLSFPLDLRHAPDEQFLSPGPVIWLSLLAEEIAGEWQISVAVAPGEIEGGSVEIRTELCAEAACLDRPLGWSTDTGGWGALVDTLVVANDQALFVRLAEADSTVHFGRMHFPMPVSEVDEAQFGAESPVYADGGVLVLEAHWAVHERADWAAF